MVYGFVKQSGGHIRVYSEVGDGTTVRLYLPRATRDIETRQMNAGAGDTRRRRRDRCWSVEDNASLRRIVARQLGEAGYHVLEAPDAAAAMTIIDRPNQSSSC